MVTATLERNIVLTSTFDKWQTAWLTGYRRCFIEGGTWASKTYSAMQFLKLLLENYKEPLLCTVTSESMPHLKRGAMRDWLKIMGDELIDSCWNKTDFIYTFPKSRCQLEFVGADQPDKFTGGRRDILFCNELNNIARDTYRAGDMRTRLFTMADWNPTGEFFFHDEHLADEDGNVYHNVTYKDTPEVITQSQIANIESYRDKDPNWYNVYALGMMGKVEGLVHPYFQQVDELPDGDYDYGLDWGYSSDPTVLVKNVFVGGNLYSKQLFYNRNPMTNEDICRELTLLKFGPGDRIYAGADEPKSIEEIRQKGFNIQESVKGPGSVKFGTRRVNEYYQFWTKDSLDCIKDQRNFRFIKRIVEGREILTDDTTHQWSHGMEARRYGVASYQPGGVMVRHSQSRSEVMSRSRSKVFAGGRR